MKYTTVYSRIIGLFSVLILLHLSILSIAQTSNPSFDVVVYGGTSAGVIAAIQAKKMGKTVILLEPGDRLGGLTTGGLGQTDIGNKQVIGGLSR
jgi:hypothetical protein